MELGDDFKLRKEFVSLRVAVQRTLDPVHAARPCLQQPMEFYFQAIPIDVGATCPRITWCIFSWSIYLGSLI